MVLCIETINRKSALPSFKYIYYAFSACLRYYDRIINIIRPPLAVGNVNCRFNI